jgi:hypothetical protein
MTRRILGRSNLPIFFWCGDGCGELRFLLGVFEKPCGWRGVFCGQSVVNCVVKMVLFRTLIAVGKMGQGFRLYFLIPPAAMMLGVDFDALRSADAS